VRDLISAKRPQVQRVKEGGGRLIVLTHLMTPEFINTRKKYLHATEIKLHTQSSRDGRDD